MLNVISILIGVFALLTALPALLPFLGWANWLILPVAAVGAAIGQMSGGSKIGRNLNLLVFGIGVVRLMLGGGIL